jgi:transcriptional regulator with XRE-family HTH domain
MGFGDRLRQARNAKELSGEELGRRLALSKASISHWEKERYEPNLGQLRALCDELGVSADWLLERPGMDLSAEAIQEAMAYEALSLENRRKWRALRHTMFSPAPLLAR